MSEGRYKDQVALAQRRLLNNRRTIRPVVDGLTYKKMAEIAPEFGSFGALVEHLVATHVVDTEGDLGDLSATVVMRNQFLFDHHTVQILNSVRRDTGKSFDEIIQYAVGLIPSNPMPD